MAIRSKRINSRAKGCRGERMFRDILRAEGYLKARRGQQFCGSPDSPDVICEELPEIAFEVKFCENTSADKWLDKAEKDHPGKIVIIAHKQKHSPWKYYCRRIMEIIRRSDLPKVFANAWKNGEVIGTTALDAITAARKLDKLNS